MIHTLPSVIAYVSPGAYAATTTVPPIAVAIAIIALAILVTIIIRNRNYSLGYSRSTPAQVPVGRGRTSPSIIHMSSIGSSTSPTRGITPPIVGARAPGASPLRTGVSHSSTPAPYVPPASSGHVPVGGSRSPMRPPEPHMPSAASSDHVPVGSSSSQMRSQEPSIASRAFTAIFPGSSSAQRATVRSGTVSSPGGPPPIVGARAHRPGDDPTNPHTQVGDGARR